MRRNGWGSCPIYRAKFEIFWNFFEIFMNFLASQRLFSNLNGQIAVSATCRLPVGPPPALSVCHAPPALFGLTGRAGPCRARAVPCRPATGAVPCRAGPRARPAAQARHGYSCRAGTARYCSRPCRLQVPPCLGPPVLARPVWPPLGTGRKRRQRRCLPTLTQR